MLTSYHNATLTQLRGIAWMALEDTGYVVRGTVTDDAGGGGTHTFSTVGTYSCRIDPLGSRSGEIANQINERTTHIITVPPETSVTESDRFRIDGIDYEITAVRSRTQEPIRELEAVKA